MRDLGINSGLSIAAAIDDAVAAVQAKAPAIVESATVFLSDHPLIVPVAGGAAVGAIILENMFALTVRDNEAAVFRSRLDEKLVVRLSGTYGLHQRLRFKEEKFFAAADLTADGTNMKFSPARLVNDRGRFHLGNFVFTITDEPVQTAEGAIVNASASVTFRLDRDHIKDFVNYALESFGHAFIERLKSSINNEIGAHDRDIIIGNQREAQAHLETAFKEAVEGAPGRSKQSGLGIVIEPIALSVKPAAQTKGKEPSGAVCIGFDDIVSFDAVRRLNDLIRREDREENRAFLKEIYAKLLEETRMIQVARELSAAGNIVVVTPDEAGLTKSVAAAEHFARRREKGVGLMAWKGANDEAA